VNKTIAIVQPVIPDYREPLFSVLADAYGDQLHVYAGNSAARATIPSAANERGYFRPLANRYFVGDRVLWQSGCEEELLSADLVIASGTLRTLSTLWLLARRRGRGPTILWGHVHGRHSRLGGARRTMLRASDGFLSYTETDALVARNILPANRVWTANNSCVWAKDCKPPAGAMPKNVLYVGRLVAEKKPGVLLEAFALLAARGSVPSAAQLIFVGDGPLRASLEGRAAELGLQDRVVFHGHVWKSQDLWPVYDSALVATSPGYVGLSAIQAFARGVTFIVSRDEPHSPEIEACQEGFNTFFFDTDSVEHLATVLVSCFAAKAELKARRAAIAAAIATRYTYDNMVQAFRCAIDTFIS
jgi:glycosyltransferase involved in cell wall biosynthesis